MSNNNNLSKYHETVFEECHPENRVKQKHLKGFLKKLYYMSLNPQSKLETCVAVLKKVKYYQTMT